MKQLTDLVRMFLMLLSSFLLFRPERKIDVKDLPAAVQRTVETESARSVIRGFSEEKESAKIYYEVRLTVDGHSKDVLMDSDGNVVEVEDRTGWPARESRNGKRFLKSKPSQSPAASWPTRLKLKAGCKAGDSIPGTR